MGNFAQVLPQHRIPGSLFYIAQEGAELARQYSRSRASDSIGATFGEVRAWTLAYSIASCQNFPGSGGGLQGDLRRMASDGRGPLDMKATDAQDGMGMIRTVLNHQKRLRGEVLKQRKLAQDALSSPEALVQFNARITDPLVIPSPWRKAFGFTESAPQMGATFFRNQKIAGFANPQVRGDLSPEQGQANLALEYRDTPVNYIVIEAPVDPIRMAQADMAGYSLAAKLERIAQTSIEQKIGDLLFRSNASLNYVGAMDLNASVEGDGTALASATVNETYEGMVLVLNTAIAAASDALPMTKCVVAQQVAGKLRNVLANTGISAWETLQKAYPGIEFSEAVYLNSLTSFDSGTKHGVLVTNDGPDGALAAVTDRPLMMVYHNGLQTVTTYVSPFAGLHYGYSAAIGVGDFAV
jgi:hypothetical protein